MTEDDRGRARKDLAMDAMADALDEIADAMQAKGEPVDAIRENVAQIRWALDRDADGTPSYYRILRLQHP